MKVLAEHLSVARKRLEEDSTKPVGSRIGFVLNTAEIAVDQVRMVGAAAIDFIVDRFAKVEPLPVESQLPPAEAA